MIYPRLISEPQLNQKPQLGLKSERESIVKNGQAAENLRTQFPISSTNERDLIDD